MVREPEVTKAEILTALSHALDLVEGQPRGHAVRTCLIAQRLAEVLELPEEDRDALLFAALLKDSGCSNNAARIHKLFGGDELLSKRLVKVVDWSNPLEGLRFAWANTERGKSIGHKVRRMLQNIGPPAKVMDEVTQARCSRGAEIALMLGFGPKTAEAIRDLDEHWDGKGSPRHKRGDEAPLLARILCLSQTAEVFVDGFGVDAAVDMAKERAGRWFDPDIVVAFLEVAQDHEFWERCRSHAEAQACDLPVPAAAQEATPADIDRICASFAMIIDAKSAFTAEHSTRVTEWADQIATAFGFDSDRRQTLRRACLLHDIGKLGVSNAILEKPGKPTDVEMEQIRLHPRFTYEILSPIRGFSRLAEVAAAHHERLDGKGYWRGLCAEDLDLDMRIVAVADVFDALTADRPYRDAMPVDAAMAILWREAGAALDADCVAVLDELVLGQRSMAA